VKSLPEKQALQQIPKRLAALMGLKESDVGVQTEAAAGAKSRRADLAVAAGAHKFAVEYKSRANAADVLAAIRVAREQAAASGRKVIPLVAAPFMGEVGRQLCAEAGVNWLDLSGNAHLEAPGLHVHVEGKPNQFARPGRPSTVFAPKSARIARWLLVHPEHSFSQQQLADATGLDKGLTSRVVRELEEQGLISRDDNGAVKVADFDALLEAWREAYDFSKHHLVRGHVAARSSDDVLRQLAGGLKQSKAEHAATGLAAAWLLNQFAGFRLVVFYVAKLPSEDERRAMGFHAESRGENVWLVVPNDEGVFHGAAEREGIRCVHPVQAYLDLKNHPERSAEAAEELRKKLLKPSHA
jgi:DNA-binding MarR family transcriptional regulator